ncbi:hypothetical protein V6N13_086960 [Hibiscus sabdariffa]
MSMEGSPQVTRRTTRSYSASSNAVESAKPTGSYKSTVNDLGFRQQPLSLEDLLSPFPGRRTQVLELLRLLGPLNSPLFPILVYGTPSTGKTSVTLQLLFHRKDSGYSYSSVKRCDRPSDFDNYLHEALENVVSNLKGNSGTSSSKMSGRPDGIKVEHVQDWDKNDLRRIFMANQANHKLYASFLKVTRHADELAAALSSLFKKYHEPLSDKEVAPGEEMKRKLSSQIQTHITSALNETFQVQSLPLLRAETNKETKKTNSSRMP